MIAWGPEKVLIKPILTLSAASAGSAAIATASAVAANPYFMETSPVRYFIMVEAGPPEGGRPCVACPDPFKYETRPRQGTGRRDAAQALDLPSVVSDRREPCRRIRRRCARWLRPPRRRARSARRCTCR